jgi:thioredoxin-dependent peroxiredoxin
MRLQVGQPAVDFQIQDAEGRTRSLSEYRGRPLLLQFYRYASCPMCDLRLHDFAREYPRLQAKGLEAIAFFHSSPERVRRHFKARPMPFPLAGDPDERVYRAYGVERSWVRLLGSMLKPGFYADWIRSMRHGYWGGVALQMATMPADFLIGPDGRLVSVHYGRDIGDHLPAAEVEALLSSATPVVGGATV